MTTCIPQNPNALTLAEDQPSSELDLENSPSNATNTPPPVYSVLSKNRKRWIVCLVAFAGWFSTLSSFIYFPAITVLADSLETSITKINLTVTSYLVVSAVAPAITADVADMSGRRPVFIVTLAIYVVANAGLALQRSYSALLVLRMVQSAGISGVFAVVYGVVADIACPAERGGFVGVVSFGTNTAPALGPLLGAGLLVSLGWTSIFWFLSISAGVCLVLIIFTLPETARNIVGNGSIPVSGIHGLPLPISRSATKQIKSGDKANWHFPNPLTSIYRLRDKDTAILVVTLSIFYMTYTCLQATLSTLFISLYGFSDLQAGLIYLPFGIGCAIAALATGKILDRDYRITAKANGFPMDKKLARDTLTFPIAKARLRSIAYPMAIAIVSIAGYGWSLQAKAHVAVPLTLQFVIGSMLQSCFTAINTLLTDLNYDAPSTAQASCNIVRCALAGVGLAAIQPLIDAVGVGWSFTLLAAICALSAPLLVLQWRKSFGWRMSKEIKPSNAGLVEKERIDSTHDGKLEDSKKYENVRDLVT